LAEWQRANGNPDQPQHRNAQRSQHAPDVTVAAFV
jgi:hypothetical protein